MIIKIIILLFISTNVLADTLSIPTTYSTNGQVTASNLNGNFSAVAAKVNGGLDNTNADTTNGYRFFETKSTLPTAGSQGRTVFLTTDNTLNLDTGSTFVKSVVVSSPSASQVPVYSGSAWVATSIANLGIPSGVIVMWSGTIATIPSGWYLCDGSNGTPNLTNKFIVGADADSGGVAKTTYTGSATQSGGSLHHTHLVSGNTSAPTTGGDAAGSGASGSNATHIHTVSITSGNENAVPVVYYALAYIMKS